ncbi:MAG: hypothetical protein ACOC0N_03590 [Chroococcales cyanobacterium]
MSWRVCNLKISTFLLVSLLISFFAWDGNLGRTHSTEHRKHSFLGLSHNDYQTSNLGGSQSNEIRLTPLNLLAEREKYEAIALNETTLIGTNPIAIALNVFETVEDKTYYIKEVSLNYPAPNQAVVSFTQKELFKGVVAETRYRTELTTVEPSSANQPQWQVVWAGSQTQCWPKFPQQPSSVDICH